MKKSFILHIDSLSVLSELTNEQKGELFQAVFDYNIGKEVVLTGLMKAIFVSFKNQFDRDNKKYQSIVERNKINGSKGGTPKKPKGTQKNPVGSSGGEQNPNKADNDNDSVNDSDNDSDNENKNDNVNVIKEIVFYLNQICGTKYLHTSEKTKTLIKARLNDGFKFEDFKTVIDKKYKEWGQDAKMVSYLRPETLFSNKFEGYLNQKVVEKQQPVEKKAEYNQWQ